MNDLAAKIRIEGVSKRFEVRNQETLALRPMSLSIRPREFVALVGPSGCGKSTVLNLIAGLLSPTEGQIFYDGQIVQGANRRVGYMTQKDTHSAVAKYGR